MKRKVICLLLIALLLGSVLPTCAFAEETEKALEEQGRVNFLVAGIDHQSSKRDPEGRTTSGTDVHADTVIVVSVDFNNKKVDLVSLARDTFIEVPGHKGFYKLNAAFNVGGGMDDPDGGLLALAATASELMGGVPIPYYAAVDIAALRWLVDAVGGVDLDVEMSFTGQYGRSYEAGLRHLDGYDFESYVRARKNATGDKTDAGRTRRQRQALLALYKTVKEKSLLTSLPSIFLSFKGHVWTNLTLTQMTTLALFAMEFDPDSVNMQSMAGTLRINHGWAYHFIDQQARSELISSIYGFEPAPYGIASVSFADYLHEGGFRSRKVLAMAEKVFAALQEQMNAGTAPTEEQTELYTDAYLKYGACVQALEAYENFLILHCDGVAKEEREERSVLKNALNEAQSASRKATVALGKTLGFTDDVYQWAVWPNFYKDTDINEVLVDFN